MLRRGRPSGCIARRVRNCEVREVHREREILLRHGRAALVAMVAMTRGIVVPALPAVVECVRYRE